MSGLAKASLTRLSAEKKPTTLGAAIPVQFNPTSLRLQTTNSIDKGATTGRQVQQYNGTSSTELSMELVFDTADEAKGTGGARDVREKTRQVAQFVLPTEQRNQSNKQAPPRVRFQWGSFIFDGVMTGMTEEIDFFSLEGVALRSKLSISISEQDPKLEALESGKGASKGSKKAPGGGGAGPGTSGGGPTNRTGTTLAGESAADFAVRMGLDPGGWRGLSAGLDATISLEAGIEIDFDASLSVGVGLGLSAGVSAGASLSLEASVGLEIGSASAVGHRASPGLTAGFALAAAGGVNAAIETAAVVRTESAASRARSAFGAPQPAAAPLAVAAVPGVRPSRAGAPTVGLASLSPQAAAAVGAGAATMPPGPPLPDQPRAPLRTEGMGPPGAGAGAPRAGGAGAPRAPRPPVADPRSASFGLGVPLRPRVAGAAVDRQGGLQGVAALGARRREPSGVEAIPEPSTPPWVVLPSSHLPRTTADAAQQSRRPSRPCGCGGLRTGRGPCRRCGGTT